VPGDDWDQTIAQAQSESAVSLILVSSRSDKAYYQREEIVVAIEMARDEQRSHRVVPIYVGGYAAIAASLPYGLRLKHAISLMTPDGLVEVAEHIRKTLRSSVVMSAEEIMFRYEARMPIERAVRLLPMADFDRHGLLGKVERKYVFVGDYDEQRHRTLRQILSNLWVGDAFEQV